MNLLKYIFLGILQGFTEPLPISSSGHIFLFKSIFHTAMFDDLNLEIFLNFASFLAILIIFKEDVLNLIKGVLEYFKTKGKKNYSSFRYFLNLVISSIPVGILGLLIKNLMEEYLARNLFLVGIGFLITGVFLVLVFNKDGNKTDKDISYKDAIIIGLFQAIALVPGISRSGLTLVGCLLCGLNRREALKYTFMLYFPVSIFSMIIGIKDFTVVNTSFSLYLYYMIGMVAAGVLTYLSYKWLTKLVENGKLWRFSIYLFAIALFTIIFFI